jgi:hypothetical protein
MSCFSRRLGGSNVVVASLGGLGGSGFFVGHAARGRQFSCRQQSTPVVMTRKALAAMLAVVNRDGPS